MLNQLVLPSSNYELKGKKVTLKGKGGAEPASVRQLMLGSSQTTQPKKKRRYNQIGRTSKASKEPSTAEDLSLFRSSPTAGLPVSRRHIGTEERRWPPAGGPVEPAAQQSRNSAWAATQVNSEVHTASASLTPASVTHLYEHLNSASGSDLAKMPSELVSRAIRLKQFKK